MAAGSSLEAVKKKIKSLQEQADVAEERAALLQRELNQEKRAREAVSGHNDLRQLALRRSSFTRRCGQRAAEAPHGPARPRTGPRS